MPINFEFKARCRSLSAAEAILMQEQALFIGTDHQVDTYFNSIHGRLKLREGNIEHALIHYDRLNEKGAKRSDVTLYKPAPDPALKEALEKALGIKVVVDKRRKIYFIGNVKFHLDSVEGLGEFLEVEAIDKEGTLGNDYLKHQCSHYAQLLGVTEADYVSDSYSDMLLAKKSSI